MGEMSGKIVENGMPVKSFVTCFRFQRKSELSEKKCLGKDDL